MKYRESMPGCAVEHILVYKLTTDDSLQTTLGTSVSNTCSGFRVAFTRSSQVRQTSMVSKTDHERYIKTATYRFICNVCFWYRHCSFEPNGCCHHRDSSCFYPPKVPLSSMPAFQALMEQTSPVGARSGPPAIAARNAQGSALPDHHPI